LILEKIIKIVATRCEILRLKCTKFDFPDPVGGAYSAPPDTLPGFKGPTSKRLLLRGGEGWGGEGKAKEEGGGMEGSEREGREGKVRVHTGTSFFSH